MTNLSRFDTREAANEGRWLTLEDPETGSPLMNGKEPVRILLCGMDSNAFIRQSSLNRSENIKEQRLNKPWQAGVEDDRTRKLLIACTKGWENLPTSWVDGGDSDEPISFSVENADKLYQNMRWVQEAVDRFVGDRKNYFADSSKK